MNHQHHLPEFARQFGRPFRVRRRRGLKPGLPILASALVGAALVVVSPQASRASGNGGPIALAAGSYQVTAVVDASEASYAFDAQNVVVALLPQDGSLGGQYGRLCGGDGTTTGQGCGESVAAQVSLAGTAPSYLEVSMESPGIYGPVDLTPDAADIAQLGPTTWVVSWTPRQALLLGGYTTPKIFCYLSISPNTGAPSGGTGSGHAGSQSAARGDPVNSLTGSLFHQDTDLATRDGELPLSEVRSYNSFQPALGPFGWGWSGAYTRHLNFFPSATTAVLDDGSVLRFDPNTLQQTDGSTATLTQDPTAGSYRLDTADGTASTFDAAGRLLTLSTADGQTATAAYDTAGHLSAITGASQRISFAYSGDLVTSVTLPDGRQATYGYDAAGDLTSATDPTGNIINYGYDDTHHLTTVADGTDTPYLTTTYDPFTQRVTSQQDGLGNTSTFATRPDGNKIAQSYRSASSSQTTDVFDLGGVLQTISGAAVTTFSYGNDHRVSSLSTSGPGISSTSTFGYDAAGDLVSTTGTQGTVSATYNAARQITSAHTPNGDSATTYDGQGRVATQTDPTGTTTYGYSDATPFPTSIAYPGGLTEHLRHDAAGNVTALAGPAGTTTIAYDATNRVTAVTDPRGNLPGAAAQSFTRHYTWTAADLVASATDPLGHTTRYSYDADGELLTSQDPLGRTTQRTYDADGHLLTLTAPSGATTTYAYDSSGNLTSTTDPLGNVTTQTWDPITGLLEFTTNPQGARTVYGYDAQGNLTSTTDPLGNVTTSTYDAAGRFLTTTAARGNVGGADRRDFTTTNTYDPAGRLLTTTTGDGATTTYTYDAAGRRTDTTDPLGRDTHTTYDGAGRVTAVRSPLGETTTYAYDAAGYLAAVTDPLGRTTTYTHDPVGNLLRQTTPAGDTTSWSYDADNDLLTLTTPRGNQSGASAAAFTTHYAYDAAGQRTDTTDPLGQTTHTDYDTDSDPIKVTDPAGDTTTKTYDADGHLTQITNPLGATTRLSYDQIGDVTSRTDGDGNTTTYRYDADGDQTTRITPNGDAFTSTYDADRNKITDTGPDQNRAGLPDTTGYSYDSEDRLTQTSYDRAATVTAADITGAAHTYSVAAAAVTSQYDADGEIVQRTDAQGTTRYTYDADGQLTKTTGAVAVAYAYDPDGRVIAETYPDGTITHNTYDVDGRLSSTQASGIATSTFSYDADGQLTSRVAGGLTVTEQHDPLDRLTTLQATTPTTTVANLTQTYTTTGQVNSRSFTSTAQATAATLLALTGLASGTSPLNGAALGTHTYQYDRAGDLTQDCAGACTTTQTSWTYDAAGNRLTQNAPAGTTAYSYDPDNELTKITRPNGQSALAYDSHGNPVSQIDTTTAAAGAPATTTTTSRAYNEAGQLALEITGGKGTQYTYDADGDRTRIQHVTAGTAGLQATTGTALVWDPAADQPQLLTDADATSGLELHRYVWSAGQLTGLTTNPTAATVGATNLTSNQSVVTDDLGSPVALTEADGTPDTLYSYDTWGNRGSTALTATGLTNTAPPTGTTGRTASSVLTNPITFTGGYTTSHTTVALRARDLNPTTGRFDTPDPLAAQVNEPDQTAIDNYHYARNDPLDLTDPLGLQEHEKGLFGWLDRASDDLEFGLKATVDFLSSLGPGLYNTIAEPINAISQAFCVIITAGDQICHGVQAVDTLDYCPFTQDNEWASCAVGQVVGGLVGAFIDPAAIGAVAEDVTVVRNAAELEQTLKGAAAEAGTVAADDLAGASASNYGRFLKSLPSGAGDPTITQLPDGALQFEANVPASNIPGSFARYTKVVDSSGKTTSFYKTTFAPDGSIVHVKVKYP